MHRSVIQGTGPQGTSTCSRVYFCLYASDMNESAAPAQASFTSPTKAASAIDA